MAYDCVGERRDAYRELVGQPELRERGHLADLGLEPELLKNHLASKQFAADDDCRLLFLWL